MSALVADRVVVELEARLGRYEANVASAERKFDKSMSAIQKSASRTEALVNRAASSMGAALGGISVLALARGFLALADEAKNLDAQLRLATAQTGNFGKATDDVRRIADVTRSGLSETATLYATFVRNGRELGLTQAQAARATETFAKTLTISGAGASESAASIRQFSQALASGVLRGDEFNSVMENAPRLARLLADSLGVPIGQLRAMAEEGQLTADKLTKALTDTKFTKGIDAEFRQMPVIFDQAMTKISNAAVVTFGAFDRGGQFSTALANFVSDGSDGFSELERKAEEFGVNARANIEGLASAFAPVFAEAARLFEFLSGGFQGIDIGRDIQKSLDDIDRATRWLNGQGMLGNALVPGSGSDLGGRFRQSRGRSAQISGTEAAVRRVEAMFGTDPFRIAGSGSTAPRVSAAGKKKALKTPKGKTVQSVEEWVAEINRELSTDTIIAANRFGQQFGDGAQRDAVDEADRRKDKQSEANEAIAKDFHRRMEDQVTTLASIYEDAFLGGTGSIWDSFKRIGLRVIAEVLARFTLSQLGGGGGGFNFGNALGSAIGSVLPGFASGGSFTVGGRGGSDTNRLSLNGRPIANVSRGESISVGSRALRGGQSAPTVISAPQFDLRGAVITPKLYADMERIANDSATRAATAMGRGVLQAVPNRMAQFQRDGT